MKIDIRLNAPQGFMLIPTENPNQIHPASINTPVLMPLRASCSFQLAVGVCVGVEVLVGLNAPQGFMLIPTEKIDIELGRPFNWS